MLFCMARMVTFFKFASKLAQSNSLMSCLPLQKEQIKGYFDNNPNDWGVSSATRPHREDNTMTATREEVYEEYRTADFSRRLDIYLQFPELRNAFHEIGPGDAKTDFFKTASHRQKSPGGLGKIIRQSRTLFKFRVLGSSPIRMLEIWRSYEY